MLPDIPRLYTALAEILAAVLYAQAVPPRTAKPVYWAVTSGWGVLLAVFLQMTGDVPLAWWIPCMAAAIGWLYLYLWGTREMNLLEAGYSCARAFILAELAASVEWQLHCVLWPQRGAGEALSVLLLAVVYGALFGILYSFERRHTTTVRLAITPAAALMAVVMAVTVFAVSNLSFVADGEATMSVFYIRTLVDFAGVLILTVQHEQLREAALHSELAAMDNVLHRQYEQYKQSKENIRLINRRYHELKMQIAAIRAERDQAKQDAALAEMESGIRRYEAENKTGNPVLDTLLTAKTLYCQQHDINLTCVADGRLLNFLTTGEICTIVGTALDNATESVLTEADAEKRLIRAAIYAQNGFVMLRFENYCAQPVELGPDGLPKQSAHGGYDLKSVRAAAEAHGGTLTLHWENEWFTLRVLLPQK
ncbi:ATP-binding protein [Gemmiger sp.]